MGATIEEKFLNRAVEAYGNEVVAVSDAVANGLSTLTDPRGITAVADAYEGYFPQAETANKVALSGLSTEGAYASPAEFFKQTSPQGEVSKSLNDPTFNAVKELPTFSKNVFGKTGVQDALAQAGIIIEGGDEAGFIIEGGLGGPDTKEGFGIKLPSGAEKGFVIYGKSDKSATNGIVIVNSRTGKTLDQSIQQLQTINQSTPKEESDIIVYDFVQNLQSLKNMKSTLENQQTMSQELSLPVFSNLRA